MKKLLLLLFVFFAACVQEDCEIDPSMTPIEEEDAGWRDYVVPANRFYSSPRIVGTHDIACGRWEVIFRDGIPYCGLEPFAECHDLMKACGDSFSLTAPSNENSVMMGYRFLPYDESNRDSGRIQVTPYLNIDRSNVNRWFPEMKPDWPLVDVDTGEVVVFQYVTRNDTTIDMQIEYLGEEYKTSYTHPNISEPVRTIGIWAGGTSKPVVDKHMSRRRICMCGQE